MGLLAKILLSAGKHEVSSADDRCRVLNVCFSGSLVIGGSKLTASLAECDEKDRSSRLSKCLEALDSKNFRLYLMGQAASALGTGMQNVALGWLVYRITHSAIALSLFAASIVLPQVLLSFAGGCLADGKRRKLVLIALQFTGAFVAASILGGTFVVGLSQWMILGLAFLYGSFMALEYPARHAFTGRIVPSDCLVSARGLYSATCATTLALGQLMAGFIIESGGEWGERACFALNMFSYLVAVVLLAKIDSARSLDAERECRKIADVAAPSETVVSAAIPAAQGRGLGIKYCLEYIGSSKPILITFLQTMILVLFCLRYTSFVPAFASEIFHGGAGATGLLSAALAIGYAGAAFFCGGFRRREDLSNLASISLLMIPAALVMFSLSPNLLVGVACTFIMSFLQSANINACINTIQVTAPDWIFGRLMGIRITMVALLELVGAVLAGQLVTCVGLSGTMIIVACMGAVLSVLVCSGKFSLVSSRASVLASATQAND